MRKSSNRVIAFLLFLIITGNSMRSPEYIKAAVNSASLGQEYLNASTVYLNLGWENAGQFDFNIKQEKKAKGAAYNWFIRMDKGNPASISMNSKTGLVTAKKTGTAYIRCKITLKNKTTLLPEAKVVVRNNAMTEDGITYASKIEGKSFYLYSNGKWQETFLKGVNMGAAKPGYYPGELAITKEEYKRWFGYISEMNANVIRVYTTLMPAFYDALYEFNLSAENPIYLMQGVWVNEENIAASYDAYADDHKIIKDFIQDAEELVDILHGNAKISASPGLASGTYTSDISQYVIGWILGVEWDPEFVQTTNNNHADKSNYSGRYLYTEGASPFEAFLCEVGDKVLTYEADNYNTTRALSFTNWLTTDMLEHPNEPDAHEDMAVVNTESIKAAQGYTSGVFASYHIYPYYPEFLNYQKEYTEFMDEDGSINTYKAYLRDLISEHTVPVLVAEFGVPSSRGKAHESLYSGYNQGNLDETEQGEILADMLEDIYEEGYCGGLVFSWQDEWFKRTWNTMALDLADRRAYWSNPQTNEQEFGLLAFDPGKSQSICYIDGSISDWSKDKPVSVSDNTTLYIKSDEKYIYLLAKTKNFSFTKDTLYLPIDTIQGQGNKTDVEQQISFSRSADFLIQINGKKNSRIVVDSYYDTFEYLYTEELSAEGLTGNSLTKNSGMFNPMYLCLSRGLYLPEDKVSIPLLKYETGLLQYGDANPAHAKYNSLSDFSYKNGNLEIRIPWQLLNVMDPSTKAVIGDLQTNQGIVAEKIKGIYVGAGIGQVGIQSKSVIEMKYYTWKSWDMPSYHERLKPSYYILQKAFRSY